LIKFLRYEIVSQEKVSLWHGNIVLFVNIGSDSRLYLEEATALGHSAVWGIGV
jgi:hypothetical protein